MKLLPWEYGVRNLGRSPTRAALSVGGAALVVLLVIAAAAFVRGVEGSLRASGRAENVILLGAGSEESFERSEINPATGSLVLATVPGIRARMGVPYVSPEVHMQTTVRLRADAQDAPQVLVRGITPPALLVHSSVRVASGRLPEGGRDEIMVGDLVATKLAVPDERLRLGQTLHLDGRAWTIVGRFEAPATVMEAEVWMPLSDLQIVAKRDNLSCVALTLDDPDAFDDVDAFARQRLDLELVAMRETDYYANLAAFYRPIRAMVWITAALIGLGGLLGGLNTMYATFAGRVREIGALQSIGYARGAIIVSLVQESLLATAAGALLASVLAVAVLDGVHVKFSMGVFGLMIDSTALMLGLGAGLLLGLAGALPPAAMALRLPVAEALKAT